MVLKDALRIAKGQPVNFEERLERHEEATEARLLRLEESIISLKDVLIKLHEENEMLKGRKDEGIFEPFMKSGADFVKSLVEEEGPSEEVKTQMKNQNVDMERAIKLMRQKFGLPPKIGKKAKAE